MSRAVDVIINEDDGVSVSDDGFLLTVPFVRADTIRESGEYMNHISLHIISGLKGPKASEDGASFGSNFR